MTHYIAMAGLHGCLPQYCSSHDTLTNAVDDLADMSELGRDRRRALKRELYLGLNIRRDGNEYLKITECNCSDPSVHNDH